MTAQPIHPSRAGFAWRGLVLTLTLHALALAALLTYTPVRQALGLESVLMIDFIQPAPPPVPEPPKEQPKPQEMKVVRRSVKPVAPLPVLTAAANAPSPLQVAAAPEPQKAEPPIEAASPAPPRAAPPAAPITVSGVEYLRPPQPQYPPMSRRRGEEGRVVLRVLVNAHGRPERAEIQKSSGAERLDEAARRAALEALFKPHVENGQAVAVWAIVPIVFSLES